MTIKLVVTYMELTAPPPGPPLALPVAGAGIARELIGLAAYLDLYRAIGGPQGWDQRLRMDRAALASHLAAPSSDIHLLRLDGRPAGLCEIDRAGAPDAELVNFGLLPEVQGRGLGPCLLDSALRATFAAGVTRIWLHTDEWDHPAAQPLYRRMGFRIFREALEDVTDL
ncbi:MAG: GNAT family N-acetyltransferase [Hyphomicrobiaceae bacterium]